MSTSVTEKYVKDEYLVRDLKALNEFVETSLETSKQAATRNKTTNVSRESLKEALYLAQNMEIRLNRPIASSVSSPKPSIDAEQPIPRKATVLQKRKITQTQENDPSTKRAKTAQKPKTIPLSNQTGEILISIQPASGEPDDLFRSFYERPIDSLDSLRANPTPSPTPTTASRTITPDQMVAEFFKDNL